MPSAVMAASITLQVLAPRRHAALAAQLGVAMVAAAATESIGLMLLAPMLVALGGADAASGQLAGVTGWLDRLGIGLNPAPLLAIFVALVVLRAVIVQWRTMIGQSFEVAVVDGLRSRAWQALLHCDWRQLSTMRQSDNASLLINEVDRVGHAINQGIAALATAVTLAGAGLAALALSPAIALGIAAGGVATLFAYRRLRRKAAQLGEQLGAAYGRVFGAVSEGLGALRVIKSFSKEDDVARDLAAQFARLRAAERAFIWESGLGQGALQIGGSIVLAVGVWIALARGAAAPEVIVPLVALFARALPLVGALQSNWQNWAHCRPAMDRTLALIAEAEAAREPEGPAVAAPALATALTLDQVTVRFPGRAQPALDTISLSLPAGTITLLTGPSGAGKSTLADLVGGLIAPDQGTVAIDGMVLEAGLRRAWRGQVAYVQQDPVLFDGTIRDNLRWAMPEADEFVLRRVLAEASAGFVLALPDGLDTAVGESGHRLSGGERQRIVLARALLRSPRLLILDEATSALDATNEAAIASAIVALRSRLTVLAIGHRGGLTAIADRVIRLEDGRLIGETAA